ncbi:MAG: hypothetical protein HN350_21370 [Phycisphaerales bacterium]|jgi:hypothetical protein|nr:hypothetical protein [Phycisphaerales bacterium]
MASLKATSTTTEDIQQSEFEFNKKDLANFLCTLRDELESSNATDTSLYHLQVQCKKGVGPKRGQPIPIEKGDTVTITVHPF